MIRLALRIRKGDKLVECDLYVNGQVVSGQCGITVRASEISSFIKRLDPDSIEVEREMITDDIFHRVCGFKNARFV